MQEKWSNINFSFIILLFFLVPLFAATPLSPWIRYIPDGYKELNMDDLLVAGLDIVAAGAGNVIVMNEREINTCNTAPSILLYNTPTNWMQHRINGEIWCFSQLRNTPFRRFDGTSFKLLDTTVVTPLPKGINGTLETRAGVMIAGTDSGLFSYNGSKWLPMEGSPTGIRLRPCLEDRNGNIWAAADGAYLYNITTKKWTYYSKSNSPMTTESVTCIIDDKDGNIIICTDVEFSENDTNHSGIFVLRGTAWTTYTATSTGLLTTNIEQAARDSSGNIWFASRMGVLMWDGKNTWKNMCRLNYQYEPSGYTRDIVIDVKNRVWAASYHLGFYMLDQNNTQCAPKITINYPLSGAVGKQKTILPILWNYEGPVGTLKLEYRTGQNDWILANNSMENNRKYNWYTDSIPLSSEFQIRLSAVENPNVFDTSVRFTIVEQSSNVPPSLQPLPDSITVRKTYKTTLMLHAIDVDKDTLKFSFSALPSWVSTKDSVLTFDPVTGSTSFTFTVTVSDGKGGSATDSVKVVVVQSTGIIYKPQQTTGSSFHVNTTTSLLTVIPGNESTMSGAALYTLSGKKTRVLTKDGTAFTLHRKGGSFDNTIYILKVGFSDATGSKTAVSRLLLWQ